ncbi:MAG: DUF1800 family protein [Planctomycetota bacterium]
MTDPLAPFAPDARDPFDLGKAGHLLRRAGFGGALRERERLVRLGVERAVDRVADAAAGGPADALLDEAIALGDIDRIRGWRVLRALECRAPLRERMSVFWHDHFATGNQKVLDPRAMALQLATFDRLGLGRFGDLCRAMARDPALLRWLDNDRNRREQPNENFARELLELFTLGRGGGYDERDVREAARAFTGHEVHDGAFALIAARHDAGEKQVLGARGAFAGDDVVALAVARDESARFLAGKWLRHFVHPEPESAWVDALAQRYRDTGRSVGATLRTLLRSRLFFAASIRRTRIKSPADFAIGLVRALALREPPSRVARAMARMGERWLEPPSVEGWHGDRAWLSPATFLLRANFAAEVLGRPRRDRPDPADLLAQADTPDRRADLALLHLLDGDASPDGRERLRAFAARAPAGPDGARALLHATTLLPEYQLL